MVEKRLFRSLKERKIAGVAGGLAEYLNVDVILVRLIWVLTLFLGGAGVFVYLIAWLIVPEEPVSREEGDNVVPIEQYQERDPETPHVQEGSPANSRAENQKSFSVIGLILIGIGAVLFARAIIPGYFHRYLWPVLLIILGLILIIPRKK